MGKRNIWLRRVSQTVFLGLWIFLFWQTAHQEVGPFPPDLFLTTDPLVAALAMVTARVWVSAMIGGIVLIALTFIWGRFFCGWVCPLGTVFDVIGRLWVGHKEKVLKNDDTWRHLKYYLLAAFAISAVFGGQLLYWGDPLVLSFRAVAMGFLQTAPGEISYLPVFYLVVIIGLCGVTHRFWCRYLCPLGAFYGALARFSIFRRRLKGCDACKGKDFHECQQLCPMHGAVTKRGSPEECIRCMACQAVCSQTAVTFAPTTPLPSRREALINLNRRTFFTSLGTGAVAGVAALQARAGHADSWRIVRPPMVADAIAFNALCVRCGQCVRSCPTGTLQPLLLEAGFAGLWTPAITPRINGCKDDCNACSEACPTGAIPEFGKKREEKWVVKMGNVVFESHLCITYADDAIKPCLKCVEACPNKAIVIHPDAKPERPKSVIYDRCIGCGLCETACLKMVSGRPALTLNSSGAGEPVALVVDPTPQLPGKKKDTPQE